MGVMIEGWLWKGLSLMVAEVTSSRALSHRGRISEEIDAEPLCENKTDFRADFRLRFLFCLRVFLRAPLARGFVVLLWIVLLRAVCSPT